MSKVYLYTARATTAEKVQFDKKDTSVEQIVWYKDVINVFQLNLK